MKKLWPAAVVAAFLMLGGFASADRRPAPATGEQSAGYTCPVTGEELPCPECCPYPDEQ
ncbi:MAG: hypothetical protein MAG453_00234 [Calditrichaeota bacterium]|nr:hypothetical protein [Calditrichota bacterium]